MAGLVGWPYFFWHLKSRGQGESFWPRLGLKLPEGPRPPGSPRLWLHGVSVGEIQAAIPLVAELRNLLPRAAFIISTGTETGQMLARKHFSPQGALVCYFPLDIPWAVRRYLDYLRPQVFIGLESEIWPNFLSQAHQAGVRLALVNARLSDNSLRRFMKYKRYLSGIFNLYDVVAAGSLPDFQRLQRLGIAPSRLHLTGNLKYDRLLQGRDETRLQEFRACLQATETQPGLAPGPVWLAASTHPGEEEAGGRRLPGTAGPLPCSYPRAGAPASPTRPRTGAPLGPARPSLPVVDRAQGRPGDPHPTGGDHRYHRRPLHPVWRRRCHLCGRVPGAPWRSEHPGARGLGPGAHLRPASGKFPLGPKYPGRGRRRDHGPATPPPWSRPSKISWTTPENGRSWAGGPRRP